MKLESTRGWIAALSVALLLGACGEGRHYGDHSAALGNVPVGLGSLYSAELVVTGLKNPSFLAWRGEELTVADSGAGRVVSVTPPAKAGQAGKISDLVNGFDTEFWKPGSPATEGHAATPDRFQIGPLSMVWWPDGRLAVSEGGRKDSEDRIAFFPALSGGAVKANTGSFSNSQGKTTDNAADLGEGNLAGMAASRDGKTLWICGHGYDGKTWLLSCDVQTKKLTARFSADDNGIATQAPMDIFVMEDDTLLVLYMGNGGKDDGLIVHWDPKTGRPAAQWTLPGLTDPMGFDRIPGTDEFAVVDNNWSLDKVNPGRLARVKLPKGGGEAQVDILGTRFLGPTACRFSKKDKTLYVTELGEAFDTTQGRVLAVYGFK